MAGSGKTKFIEPFSSSDDDDDETLDGQEEFVTPLVAGRDLAAIPPEEKAPLLTGNKRKFSEKRVQAFNKRLKQFHEDMNNAVDQDAVLREFQNEVAPPKLPSGKDKKKNPKTGYTLYGLSLSQELNGKTFAERQKYISQSWWSLSTPERTKWEEIAAAEKVKFAELNPEYKIPEKKVLGLQAQFNRWEYERLKQMPEYRYADNAELEPIIKMNRNDPVIQAAFLNRA